MSNKNQQKLTARQEKVLLGSLENPSISTVAKNTGVNRTTIYKYLDNPIFAREYRKRRSEIFTQTTGLLVRASSVAVRSLVEMLLDPNTPATARVSAARAVLEHSRNSQDLDVLSHDAAVLREELEREKGLLYE